MDLSYRYFKYTLSRMYSVFYKKIYFADIDKIPKDRKLIIALNHPTAFSEPIMVAGYLALTGYNHVLLRGDMFNNPLAARFLRVIRTIPIYRKKDGLTNLRKNEQIMEEIKDHLHSGTDSIVIMSEGVSKLEKRLRPIQKGTARIAFDTFEKYGDRDITIVPIGVNFADANRFRSTVSIAVNEPIHLENYLELYQENKAKGVKKLTADLQTALREKVVHIEDPEDEDTVNWLLEFNRNEFPVSAHPYFENDKKLLEQELRISENFNKKTKEEKLEIAAETNAYLRRLHEYRADDYGAAKSYKSNFGNWLLLLLLFPIQLIGLIWNYPPMRFADSFSRKKAQLPKFRGSLAVGVGYFAWILWYLIWVIAAAFTCNWVGVIAVGILMPTLGRISLAYRDLREVVASAYCYNSLPQPEQEAITKMRTKLLNKVR